MSEYARSAGDTVTEEERQYYRSVSEDTAGLQEDMRHYLKVLVATLGAAAVTAAIANYSNKGGTRKRSSRSRRAYKKRSSRRR